MVLITGATGHFGKAVINHLLEKGIDANDISALVRDEAKAGDLKAKGVNLRVGDYDDYNALVAAFRGVDKVLLVSSSDVVNRDKQQENAVNAAKEAGVRHILYTSFKSNNETESSPIAFVSKSHLATEKQIKESGMVYTIFKNNLYLDILPMFFGEKVVETGIFLPARETKAAYASRNDMAEAAANVLMGKGHENKIYNISNTENTSLIEAAQYLSEIVGKPINYTSPSTEVYFETMTQAGVPVEYIGFFAGFAEAIKQGEFVTENTDLESLLGRKPTSLKEYLTKIYSGV